MPCITLQANVDGAWRDAARLEVYEAAAGRAGEGVLEYDEAYLVEYFADPRPLVRVSTRYPVELGPRLFSRWPAFLDDIRPLGAARDWWKKRLGLRGAREDDFTLLARATIAPIGNLRVKEAVPEKNAPPARFPRQAVIERDADFLEYATAQGAQVGGATGAGGDAPKVLLRVSANDEVWIDTWQDEPRTEDRAYLVKFARGKRTERDRLVLRSEYVYYRALAALGIDTVDVESMRLEEGPTGPSLWLPRFDIVRRPRAAGGRDGPEAREELRLGMDSVYALVEAPPGSWLVHEEVLEVLREVVGETAWPRTLLEYLRRDLLNLVFGNADNHGRNIAVLRDEAEVRLAPVYDFAPMKMDDEGITRTTRWRREVEGGTASIDWRALFASFPDVDEAYLYDGMRELARKLVDLPALLEGLQLPSETLDFPAIGLRRTKEKLQAWGLV